MNEHLRVNEGWLILLVVVVLLVGCGTGNSPTATMPATTAEVVKEDAASATPTGSASKEARTTEIAPTVLDETEASVTLLPASTAIAVASPTSEPTTAPSATARPTETATNTPEPGGTPSPTPTLGPRVTRTPAPAEACPAPFDAPPAIVPIELGTSIIEGFEPQIVAFLNAGGSAEALRAALGELFLIDEGGTVWHARAQAVPVDVTGNATADVVVSLSFAIEGQYAEGALFVYNCRDGQFEGGMVTPLGGQLLAIGGPDPGFRAIQDMNANGVPEIVLSYIEIMGTHANFTRLYRVLEWDGTQFVDLVHSDSEPANIATVQNGDGAVYDTNGNRNLELVLTNGPGQGYVDGGPQREWTDVWAWNGYGFGLLRSEFSSPVYRFQAVQDGDDKAVAGSYEKALGFYDQAISDNGLLGWSQGQLWPDTAYSDAATPTPDPDEGSRLRAYVLYRTILVHVLTDSLEEAQALYGALQEQYPEGVPGHPYAQLAEVFWQEYGARFRVGLACSKAAEYAEAHAEELLAPLSSGTYGYLNRDYGAQDVCPFED